MDNTPGDMCWSRKNVVALEETLHLFFTSMTITLSSIPAFAETSLVRKTSPLPPESQLAREK